MSVLKDKNNGTYYVKYWKNGKSATKRGFRTKAEADYYESKIKNAEIDTCFIRFDDLVREYREYYKSKVAYATYKRTGIFWDTYILPHIPNKSINQITSLDCLRFWQYVDSLDKTSMYKNDIIGTLKGAFKYAMKFYQLQSDPTSALDRYKKTREEKLQRQRKDMNVWTVDEFKQFIKCVHDEKYKLLFKTLYLTGMRKGECLSLYWEDLKNHKISVNKSLSRKAEDGSYEVKEPKTVSSIRDITINDTLYKELLAYKEKRKKIPGFNEKWFIFGDINPLAENTVTRYKDRACAESGVKNIGIHALRHSHASNLIMDGVNIVAVSKRLGHTDVSMTLENYTHLINKEDDKLMSDIERMNKDILENDEEDDEENDD